MTPVRAVRPLLVLFVLPLLTACPEPKEDTANEAPSAPLASIVPAVPRTDDDLVVVIDTPAEDPDGDEVTYTYAWSVDGVARPDLAGPLVPASATAKGQVWSVVVTPEDGSTSGAPVTLTVTVVNTAPVVVSLSVSPEMPVSDSLLQSDVATFDADGDVVGVQYAWSVDGAAVSDAPVLDGRVHFSRDQEVVLVVTPSDATEQGTPASVALRVGNLAPGAPAVAITPSEPRGGDPLMCVVDEEAVDPDDDAVSYAFAWTVDGVPYEGASSEARSSTVPAEAALEGQVWTCSVTALDDLEEGAVASASVTVLAECEEAVGYTLQENPRSELETINAVVVDADADGYEDAIFVNQLSSSVTLWWGGADGAHVAESAIGMGRVGYGVDAGDLDGDGDLEVVASNQDYNRFVIAWGSGPRAWSGTTNVAQGGFPQGVTLVDADRDGDLDLVATLGSGWAGVSGGNCTIVRLNDGAGNFAEASSCLSEDTYQKRVVDLDGDGWDELVTSGTGEVWTSAGGSLSVAGTVDLGLADTSNAIYAADADADGDTDLVVVDGATAVFTTFLNDGTGLFDACDVSETLTSTWPTDVGDVDADGDLDFVSVRTCGYCASTYVLGLRDGGLD